MANLVGFEVDPWQETVIENSFGVKPDGKWASKEVGVNVPRQNGKGGILEIVELTAIFTWREPFVIHSAHEFITSQKHFDRVWALVENTPELLSQVRNQRPIRSHGHEGFKTIHGCQIEFRSRTKSAGRGFSCDRLIFDEAMFLPESAMAALWPTLRARKNPQVWYTGSAVDQEVHNEGLPWTRVRERAKAGEPELSYFEWSLPYEDPNEVPEEAYMDEDAYWVSNPAYGIRIFKEHFESEVRALDRRTVAVELLGVGDYPDPSGSDERPISPEQWDACSQADAAVVGPMCIAFDVSPERRTSMAVAGKTSDGFWCVEIFEKRGGTNWVVQRLEEFIYEHDPERIVCDAVGPGKSLVTQLELAEIPVETMDSNEHAAACGKFTDAVVEQSLRHRGGSDLMNAIRGAKTRPLGDRWAWSRKNSSVDISPLVAATLALYAAMGGDYDDEGPVIY